MFCSMSAGVNLVAVPFHLHILSMKFVILMIIESYLINGWQSFGLLTVEKKIITDFYRNLNDEIKPNWWISK